VYCPPAIYTIEIRLHPGHALDSGTLDLHCEPFASIIPPKQIFAGPRRRRGLVKEVCLALNKNSVIILELTMRSAGVMKTHVNHQTQRIHNGNPSISSKSEMIFLAPAMKYTHATPHDI